MSLNVEGEYFFKVEQYMYHLAIFRHEDSAERIAGKMEFRKIRTGLRGELISGGSVVYNLFVNDRQAEEALQLLPSLCDQKEAADLVECPKCGSTRIHPQERDEEDIFPFEPRFHVMQKDREPMQLVCQDCDHSWR